MQLQYLNLQARYFANGLLSSSGCYITTVLVVAILQPVPRTDDTSSHATASAHGSNTTASDYGSTVFYVLSAHLLLWPKGTLKGISIPPPFTAGLFPVQGTTMTAGKWVTTCKLL